MTERPSAIEFIKQASQEARQKENNQRVGRIAELLVNNAGVLGRTIEKEKSDQVCEAVLGVFGAGYKSVEEMSNTLKNPSATDRQKEMAKENLEVLGKGIFVAMNRTFANFSEEATETITSQMTGEQIDEFVLPDQLKGAGKYVVEADGKATPEEKKKAKELVKATVGDKIEKKVENGEYLFDLDSRDNLEEVLRTGVNSGLSREIEGIQKRIRVRENRPQSRETNIVEQLKKEGIEGIYEKIEFIERGASNVDDLSRNSEYFRYIYMISNGRYDDILKKMSFNGRELGVSGVETLKKEIDMRMFLHNFYLASSKCHTIEDILRTVGVMHEGDLDHSVDREFIKFFLGDKVGLKMIPVDMAWDWRQRGYFQIDQVKKSIIREKGEFLAYLNAKGGDAARKRVGLSKIEEYNIAESTVLYGDNIEVKADNRFGIDEDIYKNFFQIEAGGKIDAKIIKEFMIWKMKQESGCNDENAVKAFELAQKLSTATFANSKANIGFAADDYAEMILFKLFRYTDSMTHSSKRERKSKSVGSINTIRHIETLVCHWLDLSRDPNKVGLRPIYSPLFSDEIKFDKIVGNSDMAYHFSSIVSSQAVPIKEAFIDKVTPKDVGGFNSLNKIYARINKLAYDLCKAGIKPVYFSEKKNDWEVYTKDSRKNSIDGLSERKVAEKMRKIWVMNLLDIVGIDSSGWTLLDAQTLIENLKRNEQLVRDNGMPGGSFIPIRELYSVISDTKVMSRVVDNDAERKQTKQRTTI